MNPTLAAWISTGWCVYVDIKIILGASTTGEMVALSQSQRLESIYASSEGTQTHTHTQSKINKVLSFIAR